MVILKNVSEHRPNNLVLDIPENDAEEIIKTGEFIKLTKENLICKSEKPDNTWTEKEIDEWIEKNAPSIKYYPTKHTKNYILNKLKESNII